MLLTQPLSPTIMVAYVDHHNNSSYNNIQMMVEEYHSTDNRVPVVHVHHSLNNNNTIVNFKVKKDGPTHWSQSTKRI